MLIVGLTGGIGSGKSTVSNRLASYGIDVVDSDIIAREVVEPGTPALKAIEERFGSRILLENGSLNRKALRDLVFNKPEDLDWLQSITHPEIRKLTLQRIQNATSAYVILSSPLLIETGQMSLVNRVCVVDIPADLQLKRSAFRDDVSTDAIKKIMTQQVQRTERLALADDVIDNSGSLESTLKQVDRLHKKYLKLSGDLHDS